MGHGSASLTGPNKGQDRGRAWRRVSTIYSGSTLLFWPVTDLLTRIFVAQYFFRSGLVKAADWEKAVWLAANEYPVSWMAPTQAAAAGLFIELICPILVLFGFLTRPAAALLALLSIVAQLSYIPTTTNLMLIAMSIWFVFCGPAALSLDRAWVVTRRLGASRLSHPLVRVGAWLRKAAKPFLLLFLRVWLALALLALADVFEPSIALATWLPITSFSGTPDWLAIVFAVLLLLGVGATPVSYALTFMIGYFMLAGAHPDVTFYPVLLLAVYEAKGAGRWSVDHYVEDWLARRAGSTRDSREDDESAGVILAIWAGSLWASVSRRKSEIEPKS